MRKSIITDERLTRLGVLHGMTCVGCGHMKLTKNKVKLFKSLKIPPKKILYLKQIHGDNFLTVFNKKDFESYSRNAQKKPKADGWILGLKHCGAAIHTADCIPLFLWDKKADVLVLAHCGWKSIAKGLAYKIANRMMGLKNTVRPVSAFIAPHIQKCCFEVGGEVAKMFTKTAKKITANSNQNRPDKFVVNLALELRYQLIAAGIASRDIKISPECTCCNPSKFFSHRRTGKKLSMMSFVYKK